MARNYKVGLIIKGNAKGGVSAVKATREELTKLNVAQKRTQATWGKSSSIVSQMTTDYGLLKNRLAKATEGTKKLATQSKHAAHEMGGMHNSMILMMGGMVLLAGTIGAISRTDSFNVLTQRIKTATKATGDFAAVNAELYSITQANRAEFESTVEMFQRMATARNELGANNDQMLKFTGAIQQLAVIGGTLPENIKAGQMQLAQMLSSNIARAEEFNSILENIPEVAARMAKGLGMSVGKMRQLMIAGKLLSKDVFKAILSQTKQIQKDFNGIEISIASSGQAASNSLDSALSKLDGVSGTTTAIATMLMDISKTLDGMNVAELQKLAATIIAVTGGLVAAALLKTFNVNLLATYEAASKATEGLLGNFAATTAQTKAIQAATTQKLISAKTEQAYALMVYRSTQAQKIALIGTEQYAAAAKVEQIARIQLNQTIAVTTIATNANSAAMAKATISSRVFASASMLLGKSLRILTGPIGLALTAAYLLYDAFAPSELDKTSAATAKLAQENLALARAQKKAKEAAAEVIAPVANLNVHLQKAYEARARLIAQQQAMAMQQDVIATAYKATSKEALGYQNAVGDINNQLTMQQDLIKSLLIALNMQSEAQKKLTQDEFDKKSGGTKKLAQLQQQIALFGELSSIKKLEYQLEQGSLKGISSELTEQLRLETAKLKQLNDQKKITAQVKADRSVVTNLAEELALMRMTTRQKAIYNNIKKLSANATQTEREQVIALTEAQLKQQQAQQDDDYYQKIIDGADNIAQSWNNAGNVMVDTFGTIGQQLDKLAKRQEKYAKQQKRIAADKITYANDPKKLAEIAQAENKLAKTKSQNALSEIGSYRAISDSAAQMFGENTKGRKAMQAASNVFTAIELANSAMRIGSYAIEAVTAAFAAPWPIGFASGAAMIAIMAGLGVAVSGGGGSAPTSSADRQANQGTGTVLGSDDKSQSLLNSFDRIEQLNLDQYAELRQMNASLNDLNNNITKLAVSLVSNFGSAKDQGFKGDLSSSNFLDTSAGSFLRKIDPVALILDALGLGSLADKVFSSFSSKKKTLVDSGISIVSQTFGDIIDTGLLNAQAYFDIKTKKKAGGVYHQVLTTTLNTKVLTRNYSAILH